jgi:hypothetical protein
MLKALAMLAALITALPPQSGGSSKQQEPQTANPSPIPIPKTSNFAVNASIPSKEKQEATHEKPHTSRPPWTDPFWSNWALVAVGFGGIVAAVITLRTINRQTAIAEKTLVLQFRPRVIVRRVILHRGTAIGIASIEDGKFKTLPDPDPWRVDFDFSNTGGSPAHIIGARFAVQVFDDGMLPATLGFPKDVLKMRSFTLIPGQEEQCSIDIGRELTEILRMFGAVGNPYPQKAAHIYFFGHAQYVDDAKITRNLSVCRHFDVATGKFQTLKDPDYEYSD